jgi:uncharacterized protein YbjT (DUF2867 family)
VTLLVLGATGVVGRAVMQEAALDPRFDRIVTITRRPLPPANVRIHNVVHDGFRDFTPIAPALRGIDACVWALGMAWPQAKSEAQYREVTLDYVVAGARVLKAASPSPVFCFVSAHGVERASRQTWARIKAEAEDAVTAAFGDAALIYRPGYIFPVDGRERPYWGDKVMRPLMPFRSVLAKYITDSTTVARGLLHGALAPKAITSPVGNVAITDAASAYATGLFRLKAEATS